MKCNLKLLEMVLIISHTAQGVAALRGYDFSPLRVVRSLPPMLAGLAQWLAESGEVEKRDGCAAAPHWMPEITFSFLLLSPRGIFK